MAGALRIAGQCFLCSERSICISRTKSRRQLSIRKKERKEDLVIGGNQSNQANNGANVGCQKGWTGKPPAPSGLISGAGP